MPYILATDTNKRNIGKTNYRIGVIKRSVREYEPLQQCNDDAAAEGRKQMSKGKNDYEIVNIDKNGNEIKDLSKVKIPKELQRKVINILRSES